MNIDIYITSATDCCMRLVNCDTGKIWDFDEEELVSTFNANCSIDLTKSSVFPGYEMELPNTLPAGQYYALVNESAASTMLATTEPTTGKKFFNVGCGTVKPSISDYS